MVIRGHLTRVLGTALLSVLVMGNVFAQNTAASMSLSDAFNAGAAAGAGTQTIHDTITSGPSSSYSPQNVVGSYSTATPSQSAYWIGAGTGTAGVTAGGNSTIAGCQDTSDPATATAQCNAINAVINTKSTAPPPMVTTTDPIYTMGRDVINNPTAIVGTVSNYFTGCNTATTTTPGNVTQDVCETYTSITAPTCSKTETVTVDALYNYQCTTTPFVQSSQTCHKVANVSVTQTGSGLNVSPGQTLFSGTNPQGFGNTIIAGSSDGVITIYNGKGYCSGSATVVVPTAVRVYTYSSANGGACGCAADYVHSITCNGTTCTDYSYSACYPLLNWSFSFTKPSSNVVITKTVTWTDQCVPYE